MELIPWLINVEILFPIIFLRQKGIYNLFVFRIFTT